MKNENSENNETKVQILHRHAESGLVEPTESAYAGRIPERVWKNVNRRLLKLDAGRYFYPLDAMDAYAEAAAMVEEEAERIASGGTALSNASPVAYLTGVANVAFRRFHALQVVPRRMEYRAAEGRLDAAGAAADAEARRNEPEGGDAADAAFAAGCEGFDYATERADAPSPVTIRLLAERLASEPSARERRERAADALEEIFALVPSEVERALRAYLAADGNMFAAAAIAHVGKTRWYACWRSWLRQARAAAEKAGVVRR